MTTQIATTATATATATKLANYCILANYRIYDRTGGGGTEDIYAETLEDAIEAGREWIEAGDWSSEDGTYRTITLPCSVREIIRYRSEPLPGESIDDDGDLIDADGYLIHTAADMGEIDEDATDDNDSYDCSGTYSDELPECDASEDGEHDWQSPHSIVGGIRENPGVWSNGGTSYSTKSVCACCGAHKHETCYGSQRNPGQCDQVTCGEADDETKEWLKQKNEENGWIPQWLADYLDCSPTVRMTEDEAKKYVADHTEEDELDDDDLEHAFAAIFGRKADDQDRAEGLWSHLNAAV